MPNTITRIIIDLVRCLVFSFIRSSPLLSISALCALRCVFVCPSCCVCVFAEERIASRIIETVSLVALGRDLRWDGVRNMASDEKKDWQQIIRSKWIKTVIKWEAEWETRCLMKYIVFRGMHTNNIYTSLGVCVHRIYIRCDAIRHYHFTNVENLAMPYTDSFPLRANRIFASVITRSSRVLLSLVRCWFFSRQPKLSCESERKKNQLSHFESDVTTMGGFLLYHVPWIQSKSMVACHNL